MTHKIIAINAILVHAHTFMEHLPAAVYLLKSCLEKHCWDLINRYPLHFHLVVT